MSILIVHPEHDFRQLVRALLEEGGIGSVVDVSSAEAALAVLGAPPPAVVRDPVSLALIDQSLPRMGASALIRLARAELPYRNLPVVVLTEGSCPLSPAEGGVEGATACLTKPFTAQGLLASVCALLGISPPIITNQEHLLEMGEDLALARLVQQGVLSPPLRHPRVQIDAIYEPSVQLSGDMYYWAEVAPGRFGVMLVDVMGKGTAAALISMGVRALAPALMCDIIDPGRVVQSMSQFMVKPYYLTGFYAMIDTVDREILYVNAGHPPALLACQGKVTDLPRTVPPLGLCDGVNYEPQRVSYNPPARLLLYTDGCVERPGQSMLCGIENLRHGLRELGDCDNEQALERLMSDHIPPGNVRDDLCLLSVRLPA